MKGLLKNDHTGNTSSMNTGFMLVLIISVFLNCLKSLGWIDDVPEGLTEMVYGAFGAKGVTSIGHHVAAAIGKKPDDLEVKIKSLYNIVKRVDGNYSALAKKVRK